MGRKMKRLLWTFVAVLISSGAAGCSAQTSKDAKTESGNIEQEIAESTKDSTELPRPLFSWDHVPLYMHMRKSAAFTQKELDYLAGFPLITLEKTTGSRTHGSTEAGSLAAAKAIKAINKDARVLYYRNVMCLSLIHI